MLQKLLKHIKNLSNHRSKKSKILILIILVICCFFCIIGLKNKKAYGYTLGSKGSAIVPGTKSGNADIWPVTHPVFIVQLYKSPNGMDLEKNSYNKMAKSVQTVIPHASNDAMWLCSNILSKYLINKKFDTSEQVYLARKTSLSSTKLNILGGKKGSDTTGRIKYLSLNECTTFDNKDINQGVFYNTLLDLYMANNRSLASLVNDSKFTNLLKDPNAVTEDKKENEVYKNYLKYSLELWSYITDVDAKGSDSAGWTYTVNIKSKIDEFLHYNETRKVGLDFNDWSGTNTIDYKTNKYKITTGESFNLRYLDLLLTLNAISNNKSYWTKGIKSFMLENNGAANISITQGIVARMESLSTEDGEVKPATVFVSCNDLTQDAYRVNADYNLSDLKASSKVYNEAKSEEYIPRLKAAVSLSKSKTYYSTSIYSSAIISRIISERVKSVSNNKLVWGSSNNPMNLIKFLKFKFEDKTWDGANWVLEPPTFSPLNYQAILYIDSNVHNIINRKTGPLYSKDKKTIELYNYYIDETTRKQKTVITDDEVNIQIKLKSLTVEGESPGKSKAINEWNAFIKKNRISEFRIKVKLWRNHYGTDYISIPLNKRDFIQEHSSGVSWCESTDWETIGADELKDLLNGNNPVGQWKDNTIATFKIKEEEAKNISYCAKVYIQYKAEDGKWYYTSGKSDENKDDNLVVSGKNTTLGDVRKTNKVTISYIWRPGNNPSTTGSITPPPTEGIINYPTESWTSEEPALAYAELKEGTIYNETFEAMAGVPTTRTLYFSSGGNEFMADLQVNYEHDTTATREYISHYQGIECEYKTNDQLKGGTESYSKTETFVGDASGKTISKSVEAESSKIVTPLGNSAGNTTVNGHLSETTLWAQWTGTIGNSTSEPSDVGRFDPGKAGSPCAGLGFNVGTLRTKAEPTTVWSVDSYNTALNQAIAWAKSMEETNSSYTVQKIADSDGQIRQYQVGDAVITVTLTGGDNSYSHTTQRSYSGGAYSSASASGAKLTSSDKGKLGNGWGWSDGKLGSGGGYVAGNHGHGGVCPGNDKLISPAQYDADGHKTADAVYGPCGSIHSCGYYTPGTDITQGASSTINYTIKVTFKNGTLKARNYDGNSADVTIMTKTGLTGIPAHALCGPCCSHDLPAIEDVWYQDTTYDTIQITKCNVYKIEKGYVTGMSEITYDSDENLIASIAQGDPNIFYNIAANNTPTYLEGKITDASRIGRIRYSLQEAQGDHVYYEEMSRGVEKRTNKCDGLSSVQSPQNPAPLAKKGHELHFASGILYSNGKTAGYGSAPGITIETEDFISDNKTTTGTLKSAYDNKLDSKDLLTDEWKRFYRRRTQEVTATVISDMLILQTSSGDQSPVYYAEETKAKAQEDFPSLQASGDVKKASTQEDINKKWTKMWSNNRTTFAKTISTAINVGSYNGKYNLTTTKYEGTGTSDKIITRFDQDATIFATAKDELGLANVKSNQSFFKPAYGSSNISSPGKAQARMDRVSNLRIFIDKIKQKPTNKNAVYETGESFVFYIPLVKYNLTGKTKVVAAADDQKSEEVESKEVNAEDGTGESEEIPDAFHEEESEVLKAAGYHYGGGLIYNSKYSSYENSVDDKVNNIVTLNAVSTQKAMVIKSEVEDQRTEEGIVKDAMETLKALEKCPGTPELCEFRALSCKYTLDTTSLTFSFEDEIADNQSSEEEDTYGSYNGQLITNGIKNSDGAFTSYEVPTGMTLSAGDASFNGFGSGQFLKVKGNGTSLSFPYSDCKVYRISSSRVKISADVYIPDQPKTNTMLFSIGSVGLQVPANNNSPVFLTSTGQTRASTYNIIGKKVKVVAIFSLGSLYDCELFINGMNVVPRITSGLTDEQIAAAAISNDMLGSGVNIGCWKYNNSNATDFYMDNVVITRCGGTLQHSASCYTTYKKEKSFYQDIYNGLNSVNQSIDWTRTYDDGESYGVITNYSKHIHNASCLTKDTRGYQIALEEAKKGNWDNLKKELGTDLFHKVIAHFHIDTSASTPAPTPTPTPVPAYQLGTTYNYGYTGTLQTVTLEPGTYKLEAWGAQGGTASSYIGGMGGYATGTLTLSKATTLNIYIGQQGKSPSGGTAWNGGGGGTCCGAGGGGATDIRLGGFSLTNRIIVAGGGGGASLDTPISNGGYAGGLVGESNDGGSVASQTAGYSLGTGQSNSNDAAGGGGGYYGGYAGIGYTGGKGGGGSSYIGGVTDGSTIAGNLSMPSTNGGSEVGHSGNGYVKITVLEPPIQNPTGEVLDGQIYKYKYTGNMQEITLPAGTYQLETWGAQGGAGYTGIEAGGKGGYSTGTITLATSQKIYINVGGKGGQGPNTGNGTAAYGGWNGGGWAWDRASGGGGATDIRIGSNAYSNVVIVAGGGGGTYSSNYAGGAGGGSAGVGGARVQGGLMDNGGGTGAATNSIGSAYAPEDTGVYGSGGGGGGGYYGGRSGGRYTLPYYGGGGGGSGYIGGVTSNVAFGITATTINGNSTMPSTSGTTETGHAGNGYVRIRVLKVNRFPNETDLFNFIRNNMNLIPDTVTTNGITIINPIWNCKLIYNTEKIYTEQTLLTCTEPHHSGGHYDYSNDICWSACHNDENHKSTEEEVVDANGTKVEQAEYITLDNFFKVYFPNTGDFYGDGSYGISEPSINRGKGYTQNMDTTEWTREKYVKFDFDVLYERNGAWENYSAGDWIPLEIIDESTTKTYSLSGGNILSLNGNTFVFDKTNHLMQYNGGSTTLVEGGTMAIYDGTIFVLNKEGTVSVSAPCTEYNFYCLLSNNEFSCVEVQYAVESINYNEQSTIEEPYVGDDDYEEEYEIYNYGNIYDTNKLRFSNFTSHHTASKLAYIDIIGRIGNFIIEDTDDMRFSNFFKKSVVESDEDWFIEGIISKVDSTISENYLSWHRNSAGYPLAVDVRGEQVSKENGFYNTWGTQEWTTKAGSGSMGVSADKNSETILQKEQLKLGYNVMFDITTMGNYNQYLQVVPYFYALNTKTRELIPVDVYINEDGATKPMNYFGLYSEYMDDEGNYKDGYETLSKNLYKYNMYLNWTNESARRNYSVDGLESKITDRVRDYFIEEIWNSNGEITGYKYLTVPYGNYYNLGTMQCLQPGRRARTFIGNSKVTSITQQSARLGISSNGINGGIETNINGNYMPEMFYRQAQRWHLTMGLPSSATFTAYREKGVHVTPEEEWFVATYEQDGVIKEKHFSKTYLTSIIGEKELVIGSTFTISDIPYSIINKYNAGSEFYNKEEYVILMTADIKAIGDVWNLKYKTGEDNGNITINGTTYHFDSSIPTFIAAYDTVSSLVDISTQQTH